MRAHHQLLGTGAKLFLTDPKYSQSVGKCGMLRMRGKGGNSRHFPWQGAKAKNPRSLQRKITDLWSGDPSVGLVLVHELVLHLLDGSLHRARVQPPHLVLIQVADLSQHLPRDLRQTQQG